MPYFCEKPCATSQPLKHLTLPWPLYFTWKIHLQPIVLCPSGSFTNSQVSSSINELYYKISCYLPFFWVTTIECIFNSGWLFNFHCLISNMTCLLSSISIFINSVMKWLFSSLWECYIGSSSDASCSLSSWSLSSCFSSSIWTSFSGSSITSSPRSNVSEFLPKSFSLKTTSWRM